jgi:hypothetical protein
MSALNGDKSRYNRARKQKIARRKRNRALLKPGATPGKSTAAVNRRPQRPVSA